jgi:hypothetical protein
MITIVAAISIPANVRVGSIINDPQAISGAWEQAIGLGKVVGFDVEIRTAINGAPKTLAGATQTLDFVWITTYVRSQGRSQRTFWNTETPARFSWEANRLVLSELESSISPQQVSLDLTFDPKDSEWRGRLQNEWYAGDVVLRRPYEPHVGYKIVGDWLSGSPRNVDYSCKHLALGADNSLVIWSDYIGLPGIVNYISGMSAPQTTSEWFGVLDMDSEMKNIGTNTLFFTGTDMSGDVVLGSVSQDGSVFSGQLAHFGNGIANGAFNPMAWQRTTPDCRPLT